MKPFRNVKYDLHFKKLWQFVFCCDRKSSLYNPTCSKANVKIHQQIFVKFIKKNKQAVYNLHYIFGCFCQRNFKIILKMKLPETASAICRTFIWMSCGGNLKYGMGRKIYFFSVFLVWHFVRKMSNNKILYKNKQVMNFACPQIILHLLFWSQHIVSQRLFKHLGIVKNNRMHVDVYHRPKLNFMKKLIKLQSAKED